MGTSRTFQVMSPHMKGGDVSEWQDWLNMTFARWDVAYPIIIDGDYGVSTRAATATVCEGFGLVHPYGMQNGVTPELRTKLRHRRFTKEEEARYHNVTRQEYRAALRKRFRGGTRVHTPIAEIITDAWGYHPGIHDGIDLICRENATLFAICDGEIVRVSSGEWWGLGAPSDPAIRERGDGIIILRSGVNVGPFRHHLHMCYGHAEHAVVEVGDKVRAGDAIGKAGLANAWHVHFMVNGRDDTKGVGDRDPRPFTDFARGK